MDPLVSVPAPSPETNESLRKYIRTFGGDQYALSVGETPDLKPLVEAVPPPPQTVPEAPSAAERLVAASPIAVSVPVAPPTLSRIGASLPKAPTPSVVPELGHIQTYASDFMARMKSTDASTLSILASEQDEGGEAPASLLPVPASKKNGAAIVVMAIMLMLAGGAGIYLAFNYFLRTNAPVRIAPTAFAPIFVDGQKKLSGSSAEILFGVQQALRDSLALNAVEVLSLDSSVATTSVFAALPIRVPSILIRNIQGAGSMAGIVNTASGKSPFFILSIEWYSATFSGMLAWETNMLSDLGALYPAYPAPVVESLVPATTTTATSIASTTPVNMTLQPVATAPIMKQGFRDEVIGNHDVRVYRDAAGRSVVLYSYWNQNTLVIARDPSSLLEIFGRLATAHTAQ